MSETVTTPDELWAGRQPSSGGDGIINRMHVTVGVHRDLHEVSLEELAISSKH